MFPLFARFHVFYSGGKIEEALTFAQNKLSEAGEDIPEALNELERTLALLAFEKPQNSPFSDLLEQSHRQKVVPSFKIENKCYITRISSDCQ